MRCMHEAQLHEANSFVTLTYDDDHLPFGNSLDLDQFQRFMKRLRKELGPVRFFHCGEYGDETSRPHYHACLFGQDFSADRQLYKIERDNKLYTSTTLNRLWSENGEALGYAIIGDVTFESAAYVARYVMKKRTGPKAFEHYVDEATGFIRQPEYATMSRRPGLGKDWIKKYERDVYPHDYLWINGRKSRPPKYYDEHMKLTKPETIEAIKAMRKEAGSKHEANNTRERRAVRDKITQLRAQRLKRSNT